MPCSRRCGPASATWVWALSLVLFLQTSSAQQLGGVSYGLPPPAAANNGSYSAVPASPRVPLLTATVRDPSGFYLAVTDSTVGTILVAADLTVIWPKGAPQCHLSRSLTIRGVRGSSASAAAAASYYQLDFNGLAAIISLQDGIVLNLTHLQLFNMYGPADIYPLAFNSSAGGTLVMQECIDHRVVCLPFNVMTNVLAGLAQPDPDDPTGQAFTNASITTITSSFCFFSGGQQVCTNQHFLFTDWRCPPSDVVGQGLTVGNYSEHFLHVDTVCDVFISVPCWHGPANEYEACATIPPPIVPPPAVAGLPGSSSTAGAFPVPPPLPGGNLSIPIPGILVLPDDTDKKLNNSWNLDLRVVIIPTVLGSAVLALAAVLTFCWVRRRGRDQRKREEATTEAELALVDMEKGGGRLHGSKPTTASSGTPGTSSLSEDHALCDTSSGDAAYFGKDGLSISTLLGAGSFGRVYQGLWGPNVVAIKVIAHSAQAAERVRKEVELTLHFEHANVLRSLHFEAFNTSVMPGNGNANHASQGSGRRANLVTMETWLVLEYCDLGCLSSHLRERDVAERRQRPADAVLWDVVRWAGGGACSQMVVRHGGGMISEEDTPLGRAGSSGGADQTCWAARLPRVGAGSMRETQRSVLLTALDIARGMAYLHSMNICHGDLKCENVLLSSLPAGQCSPGGRNVVAKVADFGLSRAMEEVSSHLSTATVGTVTHMPPELLLSGQLRPSCDVFSFGIMLWQLLTGETPYRDMRYAEIIYKVAVSNMRPVFPTNVPAPLQHLASDCWQVEPAARPHFVQIMQRLESMLQRADALQAELERPPPASPPAGTSAAAGAATEAEAPSPFNNAAFQFLLEEECLADLRHVASETLPADAVPGTAWAVGLGASARLSAVLSLEAAEAAAAAPADASPVAGTAAAVAGGTAAAGGTTASGGTRATNTPGSDCGTAGQGGDRASEGSGAPLLLEGLPRGGELVQQHGGMVVLELGPADKCDRGPPVVPPPASTAAGVEAHVKR